MSVTLKLADEDAKLVGDILRNVARLQSAVLRKEETIAYLKNFDRMASSTVGVAHIDELAGAFQIAYRANQR